MRDNLPYKVVGAYAMPFVTNLPRREVHGFHNCSVELGNKRPASIGRQGDAADENADAELTSDLARFDIDFDDLPWVVQRDVQPVPSFVAHDPIWFVEYYCLSCRLAVISVDVDDLVFAIDGNSDFVRRSDKAHAFGLGTHEDFVAFRVGVQIDDRHGTTITVCAGEQRAVAGNVHQAIGRTCHHRRNRAVQHRRANDRQRRLPPKCNRTGRRVHRFDPLC